MKRVFKFIAALALATLATGCFNDEESTSTTSISSEDDSLAGETVTDANLNSVYYKMFVLNEGQMGKNNASLDFLRYTNGKYVKNAFSQMNPTVTGGLGDTANDIKFYYNTAWITITNSGILEIIYGTDEQEVSSIKIPGCRKICFGTNGYAYVTSYAGATYGGEDVKGRLYRVNLSTLSTDYIEVGYQPEGVIASNGYVYVANSGGYHAGYDNTISVVNEATFSVTETITMDKVYNPKDIFIDDDGDIWVTSPGDYYSTHSGVYVINKASHTVMDTYTALKDVRVSCSYAIGNYFFAIGTDDEWNWSGPTGYKLYVVDCAKHTVATQSFEGDLSSIKVPYAIAYNPYTVEYYISDAEDYVNPGTLYCFDSSFNEKWHTTTGVNPGHMDFYYLYQY